MTEKEEKHEHFEDVDDLKEVAPSNTRDVNLGQMLEVHATPKEERKVLWKLDFLYVSWSYVLAPLTIVGSSPLWLFAI